MSSLVEGILENKPHVTVAVNPSKDKSTDRQLREAGVKLQVLGLPMKEIDPYHRERVAV